MNPLGLLISTNSPGETSKQTKKWQCKHISVHAQEHKQITHCKQFIRLVKAYCRQKQQKKNQSNNNEYKYPNSFINFSSKRKKFPMQCSVRSKEFCIWTKVDLAFAKVSAFSLTISLSTAQTSGIPKNEMANETHLKFYDSFALQCKTVWPFNNALHWNHFNEHQLFGFSSKC